VVYLKSYSRLPTEQNNPSSRNIDRLSLARCLALINKEDRIPALAVSQQKNELKAAVREVVRSIKGGGRLLFIGAGTSGRLGVLEAAECPPTFNTPPGLVRARMAGGRSSVFKSQEGAEDKGTEARRMIRRDVRAKDVVVGIAASGVTAFVKEGLAEARQRRARTVLITCHTAVPRSAAHVVIRLNTGPEVIAGSTRLKAATATKMTLNSLTVASMIQLGKVYGNNMVDLQPKSRKLRARAVGLICKLGQVSPKRAEKLLKESGGNAKTAILMARTGVSRAEARRRLGQAQGRLHLAIQLRKKR